MNPPAVEVIDLVMTYGAVTAVDGLNLVVQQGTVTSILGPNGAGKTTTIETCEGFRAPQKGTVRVLGRDPMTETKDLRPRVGAMLQSGGSWSGARAHEMLRHFSMLHSHPQPVDELIELLGLESCGRTPYRRLSGGQQQRLSLAMALIGRPELIFLDEPTAGLDPQARHATWEIIRQLRASGVTVVLTTHFMDEAETLSDRVHIIDAGRVLASGSPGELTGNSSRKVLRFTAQPGLDLMSLHAALPDNTSVQEATTGSYVVRGNVAPTMLATVTAWCAAQDVLAQSMHVGGQSLEDRFLELTGKELR